MSSGANYTSEPCIRVGAVTFMPHCIISGNATHPVFTGTLITMLNMFAKTLGRCLEFVAVPRSEGGKRLANGTYTGTIGKLQRGEVDVTTLLVLSADRLQEVDMSEYLIIDEHSAGYKRPSIESDIAGFVKPFNLQVWLLVLLTLVGVVVVTVLLRVIRKALLQSHVFQRTDSENEMSLSSSHTMERNVGIGTIVRDSVVWTVSALLTQPVPLDPPGGAMKVLTGLWLLLSLTLSLVYRCNLKAMLILPKITLPFNSLEELSETGIDSWVPIGTVVHSAIFHADPESVMGRFNRTVYNAHMPNDVSWAIGRMVTGRHAMVGPLSAIMQITHALFSKSGVCSTYIMAEGFLKTTPACMFFAKGSPLKAKFDPLIRGIREFGIYEYLYRQSVINATECKKPIKADSFRNLDLGDFYGVFSVFAAGLCVSLGCFLVELMMLGTSERPRHLPLQERD